jgi:3-oxoadipate enol-lactonase
LSNTSSHLGPVEEFDARIAALQRSPDMPAVAQAFLDNWFPAHMLETGHPAIASFRGMLLATAPLGLAGCYAAVRDNDMRRTIALIHRPTLVIAGSNDTVTLPSHAEHIAATVPGARLVMLSSVHFPNVEHPDTYVRAVLDFLLEGEAA